MNRFTAWFQKTKVYRLLKKFCAWFGSLKSHELFALVCFVVFALITVLGQVHLVAHKLAWTSQSGVRLLNLVNAAFLSLVTVLLFSLTSNMRDYDREVKNADTNCRTIERNRRWQLLWELERNRDTWRRCWNQPGRPLRKAFSDTAWQNCRFDVGLCSEDLRLYEYLYGSFKEQASRFKSGRKTENYRVTALPSSIQEMPDTLKECGNYLFDELAKRGSNYRD